MRERIREFAMGLGVDDVGIAAVADYKSPNSPEVESLFPGARSMVVMAFKELSTCDSPSPHIAMNGRLDLMEFSRSCNYKMARFLEREGDTRAMTVPVSYPMEMSAETKGTIGEVSLRHAAVAAGLGTFGRNNLVLHPRFGSRIVFSAVLSELDLPSDSLAEERACTDCGLCVDNCPGQALEVEGKTEVMKCLKHSQPYGIGGSIRFWMKHADASAEDRKEMLKDPHYWRLYQAGIIGFQYFCFNCMKTCPVGQ